MTLHAPWYGSPWRKNRIYFLILILAPMLARECLATELPAITNVAQFERLASQYPRTNCPVRLEGVVCWSDMTQGMIILKDESGAGLIEIDLQNQPIHSGQRILLTGGSSCGRGGASLNIGNVRLIDDRFVQTNKLFGELYLQAGQHPISASWFDGNNLYGLDVCYQSSNMVRQIIPDSNLSHEVVDARNGSTNWVAGINFQAYEGQWSQMPDFRSLTPFKTGISTNFNINILPRERYVGLEFDGYLQIHKDGIYGFSIATHGRDQLFIEQPKLKVLDDPGEPVPDQIAPGQKMTDKEPSLWAEVEGTVSFVSKRQSKGLDLELNAGNGAMRVTIADCSDGPLDFLLGSEIRITGICKRTHNADGETIAGALWVPDWGQIQFLKLAPELWTTHPVVSLKDLRSNFPDATGSVAHISGQVLSLNSGRLMVIKDQTGEITVETNHKLPVTTNGYLEALGVLDRTGTNVALKHGFYRETELVHQEMTPLPTLITAEQVKRLKREEAMRGYPVRIRGVITWSGGAGCVIQDSTMGVFVQMTDSGNLSSRKVGDYCEIKGITTAQFAPMILAQQTMRLGLGKLPNPMHPTWDSLMDGTLDTQYVEIQGVVTGIEGTTLILVTHDGKIKIDCPEMYSEELKDYENALIRIRGCLWAIKDDITHILKVGEVQIHNASIEVEQPAPADLFAAPLKRAQELLLFDAKASAFQQVKVAGQIMNERNGTYFLIDGTNGLRFMPRTPLSFEPGDLVEAVGFATLGDPSPILREAVVRKVGHAGLPAARQLLDDTLFGENHDSTLVKVRAQLMNLSADHNDRILELQTGSHMFLARYPRKLGPIPSVPSVGSHLELTGVYSGQGGDRITGRGVDSFELLLNFPSDVRVLARPSWWTVKRMLAVVGILFGILTAAGIWINLLHLRVEQRTALLEKEIIERQSAEQKRAIAEERSRIARDLHDDLGSSLTEVSMLADAGPGWPPALKKAEQRFQTIGDKTRTIVKNLDVIVWLVNPRKDMLPFLLSYLGSYAEEYLSAVGLACRLITPSRVPAVEITSQIRHNLFLAVKEALYNVVRHARASEVVMEMAISETLLTIVITDNGRGFNPANPVNGNGLLNLKERLVSVGGQCKIISSPDAGTKITFDLPLSANPDIE